MKVALVNTSDAKGGAALACRRLFEALNLVGIDAKLICASAEIPETKIYPWLKKNSFKSKAFKIGQAIYYKYFQNRKLLPHSSYQFSPISWGLNVAKHVEITTADIIHLHWINHNFFNKNDFNIIAYSNKPVVWHLHDMWAFTGGCHYAGLCDHYLNNCGNCYALKKSDIKDLSSEIHAFKATWVTSLKHNLTVVAPSNWLAQCAKSSSLFKDVKVHVIPNPIPTHVFKPLDKHRAAALTGLDPNKKYLLFVAFNVNDTRKGMHFLVDGLKHLYHNNPQLQDLEILILGKVTPESLNEIPFFKHYLGYQTHQPSIVAYYNMADIFVIPSLEDNLPNTVLEALACGTPVVGFNTGGIPDMVINQKTGMLVPQKTAEKLSNAIQNVLKKPKTEWQNTIIPYVNEHYSYQTIAEKYNQLFKSLCNVETA